MRLVDSKITLLQKFFREIKGDFYLFGSRVDDRKKGGDIDLLIINNQICLI